MKFLTGVFQEQERENSVFTPLSRNEFPRFQELALHWIKDSQTGSRHAIQTQIQWVMRMWHTLTWKLGPRDSHLNFVTQLDVTETCWEKLYCGEKRRTREERKTLSWSEKTKTLDWKRQRHLIGKDKRLAVWLTGVLGSGLEPQPKTPVCQTDFLKRKRQKIRKREKNVV